MPHPVRHATESTNILLSTTTDVYIRHWAIKHLKLSILRKEHHPLIKCRFFCLDKRVHLNLSPAEFGEGEPENSLYENCFSGFGIRRFTANRRCHRADR